MLVIQIQYSSTYYLNIIFLKYLILHFKYILKVFDTPKIINNFEKFRYFLNGCLYINKNCSSMN